MTEWIANPPAWLEVYEVAKVKPDLLEELDEAEANAIALAAFLKADLLLMDERAGTCVALAKGIREPRHSVFSISRQIGGCSILPKLFRSSNGQTSGGQ